VTADVIPDIGVTGNVTVTGATSEIRINAGKTTVRVRRAPLRKAVSPALRSGGHRSAVVDRTPVADMAAENDATGAMAAVPAAVTGVTAEEVRIASTATNRSKCRRKRRK